MEIAACVSFMDFTYLAVRKVVARVAWYVQHLERGKVRS